MCTGPRLAACMCRAGKQRPRFGRIRRRGQKFSRVLFHDCAVCPCSGCCAELEDHTHALDDEAEQLQGQVLALKRQVAQQAAAPAGGKEGAAGGRAGGMGGPRGCCVAGGGVGAGGWCQLLALQSPCARQSSAVHRCADDPPQRSSKGPERALSLHVPTPGSGLQQQDESRSRSHHGTTNTLPVLCPTLPCRECGAPAASASGARLWGARRPRRVCAARARGVPAARRRRLLHGRARRRL